MPCDRDKKKHNQPRPESTVPKLQLSQLCDILTQHGLPARLDGEDRTVSAVNTLEDATDGEISFLSNPKYWKMLATTKASAVILKDDADAPDGMSYVRCADPYAAVTAAIVFIHGYRKHPKWGVSQRATIDPTAQLGDGANIGAGATIAANVVIGTNCTIYPGCYVGDGAKMGNDCILYPNVVVYDHCELGDRVTIHAGSVIGQDGLGYAPVEEKWIKIPQIGRAIIGDDVEIGANCTIDRATLGLTEIGAGTKLGNVIVIGHGSKVGPDCLFAGLVGVAGSATLGRHVTLAGQVGISGHLTVGDNVRVGGQSAIKGDVPANTEVLGSPAMPIEQAKRSILAVQKLPEWTKRVKELEREVKELREQRSKEATKGKRGTKGRRDEGT